MTFLLNEAMTLGKVSLKVNDLDKMVHYYDEKIGLDVLRKEEDSAVLGLKASKQELLELVQIKDGRSPVGKAGLYHFALVLPSRRDFANLFFHTISDKTINLIGASDHLTTEAYYITDPEGNGIEIYWDKDKTEWVIHEDGQIDMVTEPMDAQGVLAARDFENPSDRMPEGTKMGHVHLQVANLPASEEFYGQVLGLDLKLRFGSQALFYAAGEYHHHIGLNVWHTKETEGPSDQETGLNYMEIYVTDQQELDSFIENLSNYDYDYHTLNNDGIEVVDPSGIKIHIYSN